MRFAVAGLHAFGSRLLTLGLVPSIPAGKEADGNEEDTYDMLRKLVQLQRMTGGQQVRRPAACEAWHGWQPFARQLHGAVQARRAGSAAEERWAQAWRCSCLKGCGLGMLGIRTAW